MSIRPCKERWENSPALLYHRWKRLLNDGSRGLRAMNLRASNRKSVTRSDRNGRSQGSREGGIGAQSPQAQAQLRAAAAEGNQERGADPARREEAAGRPDQGAQAERGNLGMRRARRARGGSRCDMGGGKGAGVRALAANRFPCWAERGGQLESLQRRRWPEADRGG